MKIEPRTGLILLGLAGAAGAVIYVRTVLSEHADRFDSERQSLRKSVADLTDQLEAVRAQQLHAALSSRHQPEPRSNLGDVGQATSVQKVHSDDHLPERARPHRRTPEESEAQADAQFAFLDSTFSEEVRDPKWARDTEAHIQTTVSEVGIAGVVLNKASCAATLCKVEASADKEEAFSEFTQVVTNRLGAALPMAALRKLEGPNGENRLVGYFARGGHELPSLPE